MALTLSGTNGVVGAGFSITPGGAVAGIVTVGAAVTISESGIEASGIGITCANINGNQIGGRRNIIINGAMQVNQRASSYTATNSNEYTLDRFLHAVGSGFNFDTTTTQDSSSPDGFSKSLKITPDAVVTPDAGKNGVIDHFIEGQDLQSLAYGTSSAKSITISFYAKSASSNNGDQYTLMFQFVNGSGNRFIKNKAFTVTSSWQRYSVTFTGNTSESITNATTVGGRIVWILTAGPDDITSEKSDWTDSDLYTAVTGQSNFMDNTSNEFYLTGVQMEIGSQATAFEHRGFGEELALCQRYYCHTYSYGTYPGADYTDAGSLARQGMLFNYRQNSTNYQAFCWSPPTEMRAVPTQTHYSMRGTAGKASGSTTDYTVATNAPHNGPAGVMCYGDNTIANDGYVHFVLDAEL